MAKKKITKKKKTKATEQPSGTTQFALRLDSDLHKDLKNVSNAAGLSMNQLIHGICEAAMSNVHIGEPTQTDGLISIEKRPGCVFFGDMADWRYRYNGKDMSKKKLLVQLGKNELDYDDHLDPDIEALGCEGTIWFGLDYSGRGYRKY